VLDGDPPAPSKGAQQPPAFRPMFTVAKRSPISATAELLLFDGLGDMCIRYLVNSNLKRTVNQKDSKLLSLSVFYINYTRRTAPLKTVLIINRKLMLLVKIQCK